MKYGLYTRFLHWMLALGITLQMLLTLVMRPPHPGRVHSALENLSFSAHRYLGVVVLVVVLLHWLLFISGNAHKGWGHFFPWFSRARRHAVVNDVRELMRVRVEDPEKQDSLAGAIQGLGILVGTLLAGTGMVLFLGMAVDGAMSPFVHAIAEFHSFWGPVMWGYLGLHVGAVVLHMLAGHRTVLNIFSFSKR